ncbi:hypothetical protein E1B28_011232 [Marasmius oreades]|uniref:Cytochrome P450 n=1 Tax=Marasmius oreades TaxID=181124 RepID=A0A9P7RUD5_9AGAR|nr:uncharacterized protein E1B28_011232 [Marasmius oreades]KAG7089560.1 hypothetical protein E1B28_011232 [Marasmius oreades]
MFTAIPFCPLVAVSLVIIFVFNSHHRNRRKTHYPPGPKPRLLVGNFFDFPKTEPWKVYHGWGKVYGEMIHLKVLGQHIIIINSQKLADAMFEKRSRIYSDRPLFPMLDLMGWSKMNTAMLRYGPNWRMHRRIYQQGFRANVVPDYQSILSPKVGQLLSNLHQSPDLFSTHIRGYATAAILAVVYGYETSSSNDTLAQITEEATRTSSDATHASAAVVNLLPFLRHLPLEFPIFEFQRIALRTRKLLKEMRRLPYEYVKNNTETSSGKFSLLGDLLENHTANGGDKYQEDVIIDTLTTAYAAGQETTVSLLTASLLAMALHPEAQKRAQRELDTVVGKDRLPSFTTDRSNLPYVEAVLRETLRWSPSVPLGVPHAAFLDDTIDGYFIPKGTLVLGNTWAMTRDESVYPEPESFIPERFLSGDGTLNEDEMLLSFGFGRRICPGRYFAILTVWTAMASILSQFEIGQPEDEAGMPIKSLADVKYSDGIISLPEHFRCMIKPRRE